MYQTRIDKEREIYRQTKQVFLFVKFKDLKTTCITRSAEVIHGNLDPHTGRMKHGANVRRIKRRACQEISTYILNQVTHTPPNNITPMFPNWTLLIQNSSNCTSTHCHTISFFSSYFQINSSPPIYPSVALTD